MTKWNMKCGGCGYEFEIVLPNSVFRSPSGAIRKALIVKCSQCKDDKGKFLIYPDGRVEEFYKKAIPFAAMHY